MLDIKGILEAIIVAIIIILIVVGLGLLISEQKWLSGFIVLIIGVSIAGARWLIKRR